MIIIRTEYILGGFFAQIINRILEILLKLEKYNIYPYFEIHSDLYGLTDNKEIVPYYLVHNYDYETNNGISFDNEILDIFSYKLENEDIILDFKEIHKKWKSEPKTLVEGNRIWFKYFDFSTIVKNEFNKLHTQLFNNDIILGLHYRGTDKMASKIKKGYNESNYIDFKETLKIIKKELERLNTNKLFIASDDSSIINEIKSEINNVEIITIKHNFETTNGFPLHRNTKNKHATDTLKYKIGTSAIIDALLLSKCTYVLKYASQLSAYSALFNPSLEIYRLNKPNYTWYPEKLIQSY